MLTQAILDASIEMAVGVPGIFRFFTVVSEGHQSQASSPMDEYRWPHSHPKKSKCASERAIRVSSTERSY